MKQLSNRHQYDVDRYDDRRGSKHQQLFFQEHNLCQVSQVGQALM